MGTQRTQRITKVTTPSNSYLFIFQKCSIELQNDEVSDTTDDDSSSVADFIKKLYLLF